MLEIFVCRMAGNEATNSQRLRTSVPGLCTEANSPTGMAGAALSPPDRDGMLKVDFATMFPHTLNSRTRPGQ